MVSELSGRRSGKRRRRSRCARVGPSRVNRLLAEWEDRSRRVGRGAAVSARGRDGMRSGRLEGGMAWGGGLSVLSVAPRPPSSRGGYSPGPDDRQRLRDSMDLSTSTRLLNQLAHRPPDKAQTSVGPARMERSLGKPLHSILGNALPGCVLRRSMTLLPTENEWPTRNHC